MFVAEASETSAAPKLPPGVYELQFEVLANKLYYTKITTNHDALIKLPTEEFDLIVKQTETFLKPETKALFKEYKYIYKRSTLLYGLPGTGKTCLVNQIAQYVQDSGGVVLFNPDPNFLDTALSQLQDIQPESTILVIFEELDKLIGRHEGILLNILDGEIQKENVMYVATTNFIDAIPNRIKRPGRFPTVIEVKYPTKSVREYYLKNKLKDLNEINQIAELTDGFSIDELKEVVLSVKCLSMDLNKTIFRIREAKNPNDIIDEQEIKNESDKDDNEDPWGSSAASKSKRKMESYRKY